MLGLWTLMGHCCADGAFLNQVRGAAEHRNPERLYNFVRQETNVSASRFEVEELRRAVCDKKVFRGMKQIQEILWHPACPSGDSFVKEFDIWFHNPRGRPPSNGRPGPSSPPERQTKVPSGDNASRI